MLILALYIGNNESFNRFLGSQNLNVQQKVPTPLPFAGGLDTILQGGFSNSIDQELNLLNSVEKLKNENEFNFNSWDSLFPKNMNSLNNFSVGQEGDEG